MELSNEGRVALEPGPNQDAIVVRIGDDLLDQPVASLRISVGDAKAQRVRRNVFERCMQVAALVMEEGLSVGDQKLEVADLRRVDGGMIDLVENSKRKREPNVARGRIGSPHRVLGTAGPSRLDTRTAGRGRRSFYGRHIGALSP